MLTSESPPSAVAEPAAAPRRSDLAAKRRSWSPPWLVGLLLLLIWSGLADDSFRLIPPPLTSQLDLGIVLGGLTVGEGEALPGVYGLDYQISTTAQLDYFRRHGLNLVCLNVQWERLQPSPFGPLDTVEVDRIRRFVRQAWARDQRVVVALYGYGRYNPSPTVWAGTY
ncbi:MAG: hypothetical protein HY329_13215, partial [Chloroflexi bacterium]|nr:hypothetical protein [Chloroflexota bacterium]